MTHSLAHLHIAQATQTERLRGTSRGAGRARRSRSGRLLGRLTPPRVQLRFA